MLNRVILIKIVSVHFFVHKRQFEYMSKEDPELPCAILKVKQCIALHNGKDSIHELIESDEGLAIGYLLHDDDIQYALKTLTIDARIFFFFFFI